MTAHTSPTTIGLFDSGVGGLSVLRQLERSLSSARLIYLGDTARCPYGGRDAAEISTFVAEIVSWLIEHGAEQIVMACNTSAALAAGMARANFGVPIYDLIGSAAHQAASLNTKVAVLATANTVRTRAFTRAIEHFDPKADVTEIACPDLVPLVERGLINEAETRDALWRYTRDLGAQGVGAVILGCTHYPFLRECLQTVLPEGIAIIDPAEKLYLQMALPGGNGNGSGDHQHTATAEIYVTGPTDAFARASEICLGRKLDTIYGVTIEDLASAARARFDLQPDWISVSPVVPTGTARFSG